MKIDKNVRQQTVDYSVQAIKHICTEIGPREPGSPEERAAQQYLADDIIKNNWADSVEFQEFSVAPKAFMGFSRIIPVLIAIGIVMFWWFPWAPLVFNVIGLAILFFQFLLYWRFLDPLKKKSTSSNLIATKKPTGEVKLRIILSGHSDCAYEWTVFHHFGPKVHIGSLVLAAIGAFVSIGLSIAATVIYAADPALWAHTPVWMLIVAACFAPFYLALFLYSNYNRVVPGANDNLTGCLGAVGALKCLKDQGIDFEHTEVVAVLTGSEEAGLRGAKAYAEQYAHGLKTDGVETVFIGLETFRDYEHMSIYHRDLSGTVKHDERAVRLLDRAVERLGLDPLPHASVFIGASDAAALTQAGLCACTLASMDPAPARYYHTRNDDSDNLNPECMALGLDIALEAVELFDEEGLK